MIIKIIKESLERPTDYLVQEDASLSEKQLQAVTIAQSVFELIKEETFASRLEGLGVDPFRLSETLIKLAYGPWSQQFDAAVVDSPLGPAR